MKLYLSGPMTGIPDYNQPAFQAAAAELRARGYEVVSPVELDHNAGVDLGSEDGYDVPDEEYQQFLARDLAALEGCDGVVFLKGWDHSGGAGLEGRRAIELGLKLYLYNDTGALVRMLPNYFLAYSTTARRQPA